MPQQRSTNKSGLFSQQCNSVLSNATNSQERKPQVTSSARRPPSRCRGAQDAGSGDGQAHAVLIVADDLLATSSPPMAPTTACRLT